MDISCCSSAEDLSPHALLWTGLTAFLKLMTNNPWQGYHTVIKKSDATYAVQVYINRNLSFSAVVEDLEKLIYTSKGHA